MRVLKKWISALLCAGMITSMFAGTAMAAEDRTKITKIRLTIDSSIEVGNDNTDVNVTTDDSSYSVEEVEVTNDDGEWRSGDVPRVKITLEADDDYYFSTTNSSAFRFSGGTDADFVSASRKDSNSTMVVTVKLEALEGNLELDSVNWEGENSPVATWEDEGGAKSYQVRLYRGSSLVGETVSTTNTYYNFAGSITKTGDYSFKVRAIGSGSKKGDWMESDSYYVDDNELEYIKSGAYSTSNNSNNGSTTTGSSAPGSSAANGQWLRDGMGWWYRNANGTYTVNGWQLINNQWYCFDNVGYMRTGWIASGNAWYYCDTNSGAMLTNTTTPDGYRVDANGVWVQ